MNDEKILYLVTGPIGAGKSTYARCVISYFDLLSLEYICADIYYLLYFKDLSLSEGQAYAKAKQYCAYKRKKAVSQGRSFIWETVVAKEQKLETIKSFLHQGYKLKGLYIGMSDHNISVSRVADRHAQGWYNVPEQKTIDRYQKAMSYLSELIMMSDSMIIVDSSSDEGKVVMWKQDNKIQYCDHSCKWLPEQL